MNAFNIAMAAVPLIATFEPSRLTDIFVYEFFFKDNPLIRRGRQYDLASLVSHYKRENLNITKQLSYFLNKTQTGPDWKNQKPDWGKKPEPDFF